MAERGNSNNRQEKVRKALIREISDIIAREIKEPELIDKVISVTDISLSPDLTHAKVFVSVLGEPDTIEGVMAILEENVSRIRKLLGQRVRLRYTPKLELHFDDSLERGTRVNLLIEKISRGEV